MHCWKIARLPGDGDVDSHASDVRQFHAHARALARTHPTQFMASVCVSQPPAEFHLVRRNASYSRRAGDVRRAEGLVLGCRGLVHST